MFWLTKCKAYKENKLNVLMSGDDSSKSSGNKPSFVSEFSMGQLDFLRYNKWLEFVEKYSGEINAMDVPTLQLCQNYFAGINTLYKLWRPLINVKNIREGYDKKIDTARKLKRKWEKSIINNQASFMGNKKILNLVDILDELHTELMETKQVIGLGINVKRLYESKEKIRSGMIKKSNVDMPEK